MRFTKRLMRDFKVMHLVNREKGSDPDLDINVKIVESAAVTEIYDFEPTECLRQADAEVAALKCIDGCLWILVSHDRKLARRDAVAEFSCRVFEASPETKIVAEGANGKELLASGRNLDQWSFVPTAVPLFLRPLDVDGVLDLVYGKLLGRVLLFFDWSAPEKVVRGAGCELTWVRPQRNERIDPTPENRSEPVHAWTALSRVHKSCSR